MHTTTAKIQFVDVFYLDDGSNDTRAFTDIVKNAAQRALRKTISVARFFRIVYATIFCNENFVVRHHVI
jgi:hypothetical protein